MLATSGQIKKCSLVFRLIGLPSISESKRWKTIAVMTGPSKFCKSRKIRFPLEMLAKMSVGDLEFFLAFSTVNHMELQGVLTYLLVKFDLGYLRGRGRGELRCYIHEVSVSSKGK